MPRLKQLGHAHGCWRAHGVFVFLSEWAQNTTDYGGDGNVDAGNITRTATMLKMMATLTVMLYMVTVTVMLIVLAVAMLLLPVGMNMAMATLCCCWR